MGSKLQIADCRLQIVKGAWLRNFLIIISLALVSFSCKKPVAEDSELPASLGNGLLTLNEGLFQQNNSTLTWYDLHTHKTHYQVFESKTGLGLGDTGNDLAVYGDKIYIVVNNSHILHVIDRKSGELIKHLSLTNNNSGSSPRQIRFYGEFAYVSAFDGSIFKIDTTSISIQNIVLAGNNPDGLCVVDDKLLVSNSGGLTTGGDSTVSVFQLPNMDEIERITVGRNPGRIVQDDFGNLFVVARGNYTSIPTRLVKLNPTNWQVIESLELEVGSMVAVNGKLYLTHYNSSQGTSKLMVMNSQTMAIEQENIVGHLNIETLYGIQYMQILGQDVLVLSDAKGYINQGKVMVIDLNGHLLFEYTSGLNPNKTIFISPQ